MTQGSTAQVVGVARDGAISFFGSALSAGLGFLLVIVLAHNFGAHGSGVALQAMGIFSIAWAITRVGADTTAMWLLPRLRHEDPSLVAGGVVAVIVPALVVPAAVACAWWFTVWVTDAPIFSPEVDHALTASAMALPFAGLTITALAATRAFGSVVPFTLIQSVGLPAVRILGVIVVAALGGTAVAGTAVWAWLFAPAALCACAMLLRLERRALLPGGRRLALPDRPLMLRSARYGLPRTISAAAEMASIWLGIVLVGALLGDSAAGGYGAAARFVGAGVIVATAIRIAVAPRFSDFLARGRPDDVAELYLVTSRWVLLLGAPIYIILAVNAGTVLGHLGDGFDSSEHAMVILCIGSIVLLAAGNVQSLLLMSGGSGLAALNKALAVTVLIGGTLLLVPRFGAAGAAIAWVASTLLDTTLAVMQVHRTVGISVAPAQIGAILLAVITACAVPAVLAVSLLGAGIPALLAGAGLAGIMLVVVCWMGRGPLRLTEFLESVPLRRRVQPGQRPPALERQPLTTPDRRCRNADSQPGGRTDGA